MNFDANNNGKYELKDDAKNNEVFQDVIYMDYKKDENKELVIEECVTKSKDEELNLKSENNNNEKKT